MYKYMLLFNKKIIKKSTNLNTMCYNRNYMFKKVLPITVRLAISGALFLGVPECLLAGSSGSVLLSGTVLPNTAIAVSPVAGYDSLSLSVGASDVGVATILEKNNTPAGYKVILSSINGGQLKYSVGGATLSQVAYTAKYDGQTVALSVNGKVITQVSNQTTTISKIKTLSVSFVGDPGSALLSGSYSDTLSLQIVAN